MTNPPQFGPALLGRTLEAALRDLQSSKARVRQAAAEDLFSYIDSPARAMVVERLGQRVIDDPDNQVRVAALLSLTNGGAKESVHLIVQMATSGPPRVRQIALLALAELADPANSDAIDAALEAIRSPLPAIRYQGLVTLKALRAEAALEAIAAQLADADAEVRWVAVRLLEEMVVPRVVEPGAPEPPPIDPAGIVKAARPLLNDPVPRVALVATLLLARLNDEAAIQRLPSQLSRAEKLDPEDELMAVELVGQFGVASAKPDLLRRAWPLFWEGPTTWAARVALAQLGDERAQRAVLQNLNSNSPFKCARAIEAAGKIGLEQARARLEFLLANPSDFDVGAIRSALSRLGPARKLDAS